MAASSDQLDDLQMISADDLAAILKISKRTLWRLLSSKGLPEPTRFGKCVRWRRGIMEQWIDKGCQPIS